MARVKEQATDMAYEVMKKANVDFETAMKIVCLHPAVLGRR
jgi:hypothetical protein